MHWLAWPTYAGKDVLGAVAWTGLESCKDGCPAVVVALTSLVGHDEAA